MTSKGDPRAPGAKGFDALHAALGDATPAPAPSSPPIASESQGRKNATYASRAPHPVPSTRPPSSDPNVPAVIVEADEPAPEAADAATSGDAARAAQPTAPFAQPTPSPSPVEAADPSYVIRRMPTMILQGRGPTRQQKLLVFAAMLLVFVSGGIALLIYAGHLDLPGVLD